MRRSILTIGISCLLGLGLCSCSREDRPGKAEQPSREERPVKRSRIAPKIFFFQPPADFRDGEQYWANHHYVAELGVNGLEREGMLRFDQPYLNFSQSAYDPQTDSLFTWKKNYRGTDHLMQVQLPGMEVRAVSSFPVSGGSPLLAMDTKRRRILVAQKYGDGLLALRGGKLRREYFLYDVDGRRWESGSFERIGLITVSYSEALDRFLGVGTAVPSVEDETSPSGDGAYLFHLDSDGQVVQEVPLDLLRVLHTPILIHGPQDSLSANQPGVQSRIVGDRLYVIRYVDLGRESPQENYDWSYELYSIDPSSGSSRFVKAFR